LDRLAAKDLVRRLYVVDVVCEHVEERDRLEAQKAARRRVDKLRRQGRKVRSAQVNEQRWQLPQ
jgi:hypothetical protein